LIVKRKKLLISKNYVNNLPVLHYLIWDNSAWDNKGRASEWRAVTEKVVGKITSTDLCRDAAIAQCSNISDFLNDKATPDGIALLILDRR